MVRIAREGSSSVSSDHQSAVVMLRKPGKEVGRPKTDRHVQVLAESDREVERVGAAGGLRRCPAAIWNGPQTL